MNKEHGPILNWMISDGNPTYHADILCLVNVRGGNKVRIQRGHCGREAVQGVGDVEIKCGHTIGWRKKNVVVDQRSRGMGYDQGFLILFFMLVVFEWVVCVAWTGVYLCMGTLFFPLR